jgi:hypothetical protein
MRERFDRRVDKVVHRSNETGLNRFLDGPFLLGLKNDRHTCSLPVISAVSQCIVTALTSGHYRHLKWQRVNPSGFSP